MRNHGYAQSSSGLPLICMWVLRLHTRSRLALVRTSATVSIATSLEEPLLRHLCGMLAARARRPGREREFTRRRDGFRAWLCFACMRMHVWVLDTPAPRVFVVPLCPIVFSVESGRTFGAVLDVVASKVDYCRIY